MILIVKVEGWVLGRSIVPTLSTEKNDLFSSPFFSPGLSACESACRGSAREA
jgi:hypothetical protein